MSPSRLTASPPAATARWHTAIALTIFALTFTTLRVWSYTRTSATWDEPMHLVSGYAALAHHDYRFDPAHPPLLRMWAALPLLFMSGAPVLDADAIDGIQEHEWLSGPRPYRMARDVLYATPDADRVLYAARFMMVLLGVGLGCVVFLWTSEWLGFTAGLLALAFYSLSPTLTSNTSLVTTDVGETAWFFATIYLLKRVCRQPRLPAMIATAVCFAFAIVSKFSGVILAPVVFVLLVAAVRRRSLSLRQAGGLTSLLLLVTLVVIWAVYGFRYSPSPSPDWHFHSAAMPRASALTPVVDWIDDHHLLPNAFVQGFLYCTVSSAHPSYLLGDFSADGWWYYFPLAVAFKTPVSLLLLVGAGLIVCGRGRRPWSDRSEIFVIWPAAAFLTVAMLSHVNVGIRHVLPIYPFLLIIATGAAVWLVKRRWPGRVVLAILLGGWAVSYVSVYPYSLTFFNVLSGGPRNGLAFLSDSNLDWGQGLKALKGWMDRIGVRHINLAYFGQAKPEYYRMDATMLPGSEGVPKPPRLPGYVAISATMLSGVYLRPAARLIYQPFLRRQPIATIGHSIFVYWIDRWPDTPTDAPPDLELELAEILASSGWHTRAIRHYTSYLSARPSDARARAELAISELAAGRVDAGLQSLRLASATTPNDLLVRRQLAASLFNYASPEEARAEVHDVLAQWPADAMTRELSGRLLMLDGRLQDAAAEFERALAVEPGRAAARELLRQIRSQLARDVGQHSTVDS